MFGLKNTTEVYLMPCRMLELAAFLISENVEAEATRNYTSNFKGKLNREPFSCYNLGYVKESWNLVAFIYYYKDAPVSILTTYFWDEVGSMFSFAYYSMPFDREFFENIYG